jgi:hypothetical protein
MGPPGHRQRGEKDCTTGSSKKKFNREKCVTGNGSSQKKKIAGKKKCKGGKFVKNKVEKLPADFPKLQPSTVAVLFNSSIKLPQRLCCPDDLFETLAIIDKSCLLIIDTQPNGCRPKHRVCGPERMVACTTMAEATASIRPLKVVGCDVRGVALDTNLGHYCSLFPVGQVPNFAGDNALGRWD